MTPMTEDIDIFTVEHKRLIREICEKVGSNILLFQRIESLLRVIAPNLTANDETVEFLIPESIEKWQTLCDSKQTLGPLSRKLKTAFSTEGFEGFHAYLDAVRKERNQLVHRFPEIPSTGMHTVAQCRSSLKYLERQHNLALPLLKFAADLQTAVVDVLASSNNSDLNWFGTFPTDESQ